MLFADNKSFLPPFHGAILSSYSVSLLSSRTIFHTEIKVAPNEKNRNRMKLEAFKLFFVFFLVISSSEYFVRFYRIGSVWQVQYEFWL